VSKGQLDNVAILTQLPAENQFEDCHVVLLENTSYFRSKSFLAMTDCLLLGIKTAARA